MGVTTKDLAKVCGVSTTTVQRALHGNGRINAETKQRILNKAKELHYEPNMTARALTLGRSKMIGAIVPFLDNSYYAKICNSMTSEAVKRGYVLQILVHEDNKQLEKDMIAMLKMYNVDGIVINPINKGKVLQQLMTKGRQKNVVLSLDAGEAEGLYGVGIDEAVAGEKSAEYVIDHGYKKIYFIAPTYYDAEGEKNLGHHLRLKGIEEACKKRGIEPLCITGDDYCEQVARIMQRKHTEKPAFICSGAVFAVSLLNRLFRDQVEPQKDYGIMTFDRVNDVYNGGNIQINYLDNNVEKIGEIAVDVIADQCEGIEVSQKNPVPFEIVDGNTL